MCRVIVAIVALVLVVAGCADGDGDPESGADPTGTPSAGAPGDGGTDTDDLPDLAAAYFAAYADVDPGEIEVVLNEQVTWRDGSLGCPDPDTRYTQELVEGYRIVLRADGEEASYHGKQGMPPFHCADPDPDGTVDDRPSNGREGRG